MLHSARGWSPRCPRAALVDRVREQLAARAAQGHLASPCHARQASDGARHAGVTPRSLSAAPLRHEDAAGVIVETEAYHEDRAGLPRVHRADAAQPRALRARGRPRTSTAPTASTRWRTSSSSRRASARRCSSARWSRSRARARWRAARPHAPRPVLRAGQAHAGARHRPELTTTRACATARCASDRRRADGSAAARRRAARRHHEGGGPAVALLRRRQPHVSRPWPLGMRRVAA